jgi:hypothetical protein
VIGVRIDPDLDDRRLAGLRRPLEGGAKSSVRSTVSPWPPKARA